MDPIKDRTYYLERYAFGVEHVWSMIRSCGREMAGRVMRAHPPDECNSEGFRDAIDHAFGR